MIEQSLKQLKLRRYSSVGKKMAHCIWVHNSYADKIIPSDLYCKALLNKMLNFYFTIVRYDTKLNTIALIECIDFNESSEPVVGRSLLIYPDGTSKLTKQPSNPFLYHHKWMFVEDDYTGFDVEKSKRRSVAWKSVLGTNKNLSSKIGRLNFWKQWLIDNNLPSLFDESIWTQSKQSMTSKNTSMNKINLPKVFSIIPKILPWQPGTRNLDLGGGVFDNATNHLESHKVTNLIYDLFNRSPEHNNNILEVIQTQNVHTVTLSNVLNVIPEDSIKKQLIQQAHNALLPGGILFISCYSGNGSGHAKASGKDQWQENQKIDYYIPIARIYFDKVIKKYGILYCTKG